MGNNIYIRIAVVFFLVGAFVASCSAPPTCDATCQKDLYYVAIFDYCSKVTIIDASTGSEINRDETYCQSLVDDLRNRQFYEKYHPAY